MNARPDPAGRAVRESPVGAAGDGGSEEPGRRVRRKRSGWAFAAFFVGLFGFVMPPLGLAVALVLGVTAVIKMRATSLRGRGLVVAGIALAALWLLLFVLRALHVFDPDPAGRNDQGEIVKAGQIHLSELRVGDCLTFSNVVEGETFGNGAITGVPCSSSHDAQVALLVPLPGRDFPGEETAGREAITGCQPGLRRYRQAGLRGVPIYPSQAGWDASPGNHRAACLVFKGPGQSMTGSVIR